MPTLTSRAADANPVVGPCAEIIAKDKCTVEFGPSGNVMKFGGIEHGGLESNPDIAGLGIFIAFTVTSIWSLAICVLKGVIVSFRVAKSPGGWCYTRGDDPIVRNPKSLGAIIHDRLDEAITSVADAQLFLVFAFVISFSFQSQCTISFYHYRVAFDTMLVGLCGVMLSFLLIEKAQKQNFISTLLRIGVFIYSITRFASLQGNISKEDYDRYRRVSLDQTDSVLVLPAPCIVEETLNRFSNISSGAGLQHLMPAASSDDLLQLDRVNIIIYFSASVVSFMRLTSLLHLIVKFPRYCSPQFNRAIKTAITVLVTMVMCSAIEEIAWLRKWMDKSVWLQRGDGANPEQDIEGIGQLAPLVALVAIVIAILNFFSVVIGRTLCCNYPLEDEPDPDNNHGHDGGDGTGAQ